MCSMSGMSCHAFNSKSNFQVLWQPGAWSRWAHVSPAPPPTKIIMIQRFHVSGQTGDRGGWTGGFN